MNVRLFNANSLACFLASSLAPSRLAGQFFLLVALLCMHGQSMAQGAVSALGFVEPEGGVRQVSGSASGGGDIVSELKVVESQSVASGEVIALLNNASRLDAAKQRAQAQVDVRRARLEQLQAGASPGAIRAQKARVERLNLELQNASAECSRFQTLGAQGTVSDAAKEQRCLEENVVRRQLAEALAIEADLSEVRDVDLAVLMAELRDAEAALQQAAADYERALVRSPIDATILRIYSRPGERISPQGIAEVGQTSRMWVRAEIYETDISRVQQGQRAEISADGFPQALSGTVEEVGLMVGRNRILSNDPTADVDARVVEVKIKLDAGDSDAVARLTNLQVNVVIRAGE